MDKFNLRKRTTKPVTYKETQKYVKKTDGKQFIQLENTVKIKSSKKLAKKNKKRHKMVIRDTMKSLTALIFTQMTAKKGI